MAAARAPELNAAVVWGVSLSGVSVAEPVAALSELYTEADSNNEVVVGVSEAEEASNNELVVRGTNCSTETKEDARNEADVDKRIDVGVVEPDMVGIVKFKRIAHSSVVSPLIQQ